MSATVAQLGARALRKLGIAIVADASRPGAGPTVTVARIAADVLRQRGIPVPEADRPAELGTIPQAEVASRALREVGVNPATVGAGAGGSLTYTVAQIVANVLRQRGVPVPDADRPAALGIVSRADIAGRALRSIGVNPAPIGTGTGTGTLFTTANVATEALIKLSVVSSEETPTATDQAYALEHANSVHDTLVALDYVTWTSTTIPAAAFEYYIAMTGQLLAPAFGKPASLEVFVAMREGVRQLALSGAYAQTLAEQKVGAVHDELNALGLVPWAVTAVPVACEGHYTELTRLMLWPVYKPETADDRKVSVQAHDLAVDAVRRVGMVRGMTARATTAVNAVHEESVALGIATWANTAIPAAVAAVYTDVAGDLMDEEAGKEIDPARLAVAMARVRRVAVSGPAAQALGEQKVRAVHDWMNAMGLVSWPVTAIPLSCADPYVELARASLWPLFNPEGPDERKANLEARALMLDAVKRVSTIRGMQARAEASVVAAHEEVNALGLATWGTDAIPGAVAGIYTDLASDLMGEEAGKDTDPARRAVSFSRIRRIAMGGPAGQALAEQKVRAVHYSLDARGRARWSLWDIPDFAEEPYVLMAAALLAPECGEKADPAWAEMAERDLNRIVSLPSQHQPVQVDYF